MATLLKHDGEISLVKPENGTDFKLQELYALLDVDLIQVIHLEEGIIMVCDDEGKLKGEASPLNMTATWEYQKCYGPLDEIHGNALVCRDEEVQ